MLLEKHRGWGTDVRLWSVSGRLAWVGDGDGHGATTSRHGFAMMTGLSGRFVRTVPTESQVALGFSGAAPSGGALPDR